MTALHDPDRYRSGNQAADGRQYADYFHRARSVPGSAEDFIKRPNENGRYGSDREDECYPAAQCHGYVFSFRCLMYFSLPKRMKKVNIPVSKMTLTAIHADFTGS